jgi:hypothetical protein
MNILKNSSMAGLIGSSLFAQQIPVASLPFVNHGVSDTLYNLSNSVVTKFQTGPYQAAEMIRKHGPLVEANTATTGVATFNTRVSAAATAPALRMLKLAPDSTHTVGHYTTMQFDPANDCTFWYIGQYLSSDGIFNCRTRIASFKFHGCN